VPFPYTGIAPRMYPQYWDLDADGPLQPLPGGSYSMAPAAGHEGLPVPPQDGLWGAETEAAPEPAPPAEPPAADGGEVKITRGKAAPAAEEEGA